MSYQRVPISKRTENDNESELEIDISCGPAIHSKTSLPTPGNDNGNLLNPTKNTGGGGDTTITTTTTTTNTTNNNHNRNKKKGIEPTGNSRMLIQWFCLSGPISVLFYLLHDVVGAHHYPGYDWKSQAVSDLTATDAPSYVVAHGYSSLYALFNGICCTMACLCFSLPIKKSHRFSDVNGNDKDSSHGDDDGDGNVHDDKEGDDTYSINLKKKSKKEEESCGRTLIRWGIYIFTLMNFVSAIGYSLFPLSSAGYDGSFQSAVHVYVVTVAVVLLSILSLLLVAVGSLKGRSPLKYKILGGIAVAAFILMFLGAVGSGMVPKKYFGMVERLSTYSAVVFCGVLGVYGFQGYFFY